MAPATCKGRSACNASCRLAREVMAVIIEAFSPAQFSYSSGGPKQPEMLYDEGLLRSDFEGVRWEVLREEEVELDEGRLHRGRAAVVHGVGRREP